METQKAIASGNSELFNSLCHLCNRGDRATKSKHRPLERASSDGSPSAFPISLHHLRIFNFKIENFKTLYLRVFSLHHGDSPFWSSLNHAVCSPVLHEESLHRRGSIEDPLSTDSAVFSLKRHRLVLYARSTSRTSDHSKLYAVEPEL